MMASSPKVDTPSAVPQTSTTAAQLAYARDPQPSSFDNFTDRYFHQYCIEDCKSVPGNNLRILQHSNGLCVVCVDPSHVALKAIAADPTLTIASVAFGSGRSNSQVAPENIKVVGKRKKNALICQIETKLCTLTLSDGTSYALPAMLNGFILELNAAVMECPWLVSSAPTAEGFLAVVNPSAKNDFNAMNKVWSATGGDAQGEDDD